MRRRTTHSGVYDYIIVGAGIAGLSLAVELLRARPSLRVRMLEASHTPGGRACTFHGRLPSGQKLQWEAGGARISDDHDRVHALLRRYKIPMIQIGPDVRFVPDYGECSQPNTFEPMLPVLFRPLLGLPAAQLATSTIRQLLVQIHGPAKTDALLDRYPYRAELNVMRADEALGLFRHELKSRSGYSVCAPGVSSLIEALAADVRRRGGELSVDQEVVDLERRGDHMAVHIRHEPHPIECRRIVLAIPIDALKKLPPFKEHRLTKELEMRPLLRFYGVFPPPASQPNKPWWDGLGHIVTPALPRYIIPNTAAVGSMQMSYTDSTDTEPIYELLKTKGEAAAADTLVTELRGLFPERKIPDPAFVKAHYWPGGVTYWMPGTYDPHTESRTALHPLPTSFPEVYVCGESYSHSQGWMEGAVDHAAQLFALLKRRGL